MNINVYPTKEGRRWKHRGEERKRKRKVITSSKGRKFEDRHHHQFQDSYVILQGKKEKFMNNNYAACWRSTKNKFPSGSQDLFLTFGFPSPLHSSHPSLIPSTSYLKFTILPTLPSFQSTFDSSWSSLSCQTHHWRRDERRKVRGWMGEMEWGEREDGGENRELEKLSKNVFTSSGVL